MSAQVYSVPGQTEGRSKAFLGWKIRDLSHELSLTCGGNINYYKIVHHPISTLENREHIDNFQNESISSINSWVLPFYFLKWNRYFSARKRKILESTSQFSLKFCINFSAIKHNSSILFLAQALYTLVKSSLLTCKFLRFLSVQVKICQIAHANFELTSQYLFKFCIILHCHDTKIPWKF